MSLRAYSIVLARGCSEMLPSNACTSRRLISELTEASAMGGRKILRHVVCVVVWLAALILTILPATECLAQGANDSAQIFPAIGPTDYEGLFRNLKIAADEGLFAKREFFSDQNLLTVFGMGRVVWRQNEPNEFSGEIKRLVPSQRDDPARPRSFLEDAVVSFRRTLNESGVPETIITIDVLTDASFRLDFSDIERIFGKKWELYRNFAPNPHGYDPPATAPHGNDIITYRWERAGVLMELFFRFSPDAKIKYARAWTLRVAK